MSSIDVDDALAIVIRLRQRTTSRNLEWEPWSGGDEYTASSGKYTYYLASRDEDDEPPYRLELWASKDSSSERRMKVTEIATGYSDVLNDALGQLYTSVKLAILGIDDIKNDVLRDLG
ncbi:hypothetical protein [Cellulomonas sp. IC4_254]|uniref:hypothetical protein n=1 Tax=Cellulomonas sp. IC4_254 TaxID=2714040 RepID=UPI0014223520|nr:hypothetical protein [Cellulomonas sp. IC4_254]NHT17770.1 hypothetical protein [Cellulomonas sp. IC4_254]